MSARTLHTLSVLATATAKFVQQPPPFDSFISLEIQDEDGLISLGLTLSPVLARRVANDLLQALEHPTPTKEPTA